MPCVLVLAGLDPSGSAGLLADAEAIRAARARPLCVATALTVQTTRAVRRFEPCDPTLVADSVRALLEEEDVRAIKIGMIGSTAVGKALLSVLPAGLPRVVDPVLRATSGARLLRGPPAVYLRLAEGALLTPNLLEAEELRVNPLEHGVAAVLLKGGHRKGETVVDTLYTASTTDDFDAPRLPGTKRGKGCRLASFTAAQLAHGKSTYQAVLAARAYVRAYLSGKT
jgi:hydroxymethylpyrimidine/phosphomethylpyrimidine kinase